MTRTGPPSSRARGRAPSRGIGDGLDMRRIRLGAAGEVLGRQRARVRGAASRRACCPASRARRASRRRPCRRGSTRRRRSRAAASRASSQRRRRALCAPSQTSLRRAARAGPAATTSTSCSTGRPRNAAAASRGAAERRRSAPGERARTPFGSRKHDDRSRPATTASFSARDRLARLAEHVGVLERRRSSAGRRARARTFVASSRPPRPASTTATSTPRAANSANAAAVRPSRTASRLRARPRAARARAPPRSRPRSPSTRIRSAQPRTCGEMVRADARALGAQQRLDRPRRRRLAVRADDVDRRIGELRVAERGEQRPHPPEPELLRPRRQRLEPGGVSLPQRASSSRR